MILGLDHCEACAFTGVDHRVVYVSRVRDAERHVQVLDFFSCVDSDPVGNALDPHIARVLEKGHWRSALEDGLQESDLLCVRLEHGVGQASLLFLDEFLV